MQATDLYTTIGHALNNAEESQMFGKPCFKINGKAFICFFQNSMVFKLTGQAHDKALELQHAQLFDPSGKGWPMKEWAQVSFEHADLWRLFGRSAYDYVLELTKKS